MRQAEITRNTLETQITVAINIDGTGVSQFNTGLGFLDHMLDQVARHGMFDINVHANGDLHIDAHHTVEDIGITLGQAFAKAIGDKKGINRYGHAYVPQTKRLAAWCLICQVAQVWSLIVNLPVPPLANLM